MANNQTTATSGTTVTNRSSKKYRMHPYLENIHRDMNRTYDALQAQIRRSRMKSTQATADAHSSHININIKPSAHESTVPFSVTLESLLNQFSEYQASQENSFQQLIASLASHNKDSNNNSDNNTTPTPPADNDAITAAPAAMKAPPLSVCPLDLMQDDSPRSPTCSMSLDMAECIPPLSGELPSYTSADASSTSAEMHLSVNDQQHPMDKDTDTDKDMDMDVESSPLTSTPIAAKEPTSLPSPPPTDNAIDVRLASSPPPSVEGDPKDITPLPDSVTIKHDPTESTPPKTIPRPISNNTTGSTSSSSSSSSSSSKKPSSPTRTSKDPTPLTPIPLPPSPPVRTPAQPKPLHVKYNADGHLTLTEFARQLQQTFDRNPTVFKTDADRIKYALRSTGEHISRYFEPFRNKSVPDSRKCLKSYRVFLKTLAVKFREPPSLDEICTATAQLLSLRQTGSMSSYIITFRDLTAVVCWEEPLLMHLFAEALSREVKTLLGDPANIPSLSMLQVAASRAYAMRRTQPHSKIFDQNHHHSTSFDEDLDRAQELLRQQNQCFYQTIQNLMAHSIKSPPLTSTRFATLVSTTDTDTDAVSSIATTNTAATAQAKAMIPSVGTYVKSHPWGKLTEEVKQYRKDNHLCFYCGREGHSSFTCPLKKS